MPFEAEGCERRAGMCVRGGLRAVFKVLITFMVMCSQEGHKCQHSPAMGI